MRRAVVALLLAIGLLAVTASPAGASIFVTPYGLNFGPQLVGTASPPQTLRVILIAPTTFRMAVSTVPTTSIDSAVPSPDFLATTTCPPVVNTGQPSCTIDITFKPLYPPAGPRSATLVIETNGTSNFPLTGTAIAPPKRKCKKHKPRSAQTAKKRCKKKR